MLRFPRTNNSTKIRFFDPKIASRHFSVRVASAAGKHCRQSRVLVGDPEVAKKTTFVVMARVFYSAKVENRMFRTSPETYNAAH